MFELGNSSLFRTDLELFGCMERMERGGLVKSVRCWMHDFFKGGNRYE